MTPLRFNEKDRYLLRLFENWVVLTPVEVATLSGRNVKNMQKRFTRFHRAGILHAWQIPSPKTDLMNRYAYMRTDKVIERSGEFYTNPRRVRELSDQTLRHNYAVTRFHLALHLAYGESLEWRQRNIADSTINPDAYFAVPSATDPDIIQDYFLEMEMHRPGAYRPVWDRGSKAWVSKCQLERKLDDYAKYHNDRQFKKHFPTMEDFRVIVVFQNEEREANFNLKVGGTYPNCFWTSTFDRFLTNPVGAVFSSPNDEALYSLSA